MSAALIAQLRALRTSRVDLGGGVVAMVTRPPELEMSRMVGILARGGEIQDAELCCKHVTGWSGVTEASILGDAVGSAAPVPFDAALWAEMVTDREDWAQAVAAEVMRSVEAYITKRTASLGKSSGSSTKAETASCSETTGPNRDPQSA